ncbi:fumarylacetoacetate hydrolase family protein [Spirosoma montaniterrae]|uniref:2-hydroxyhepta-2,4-diene-1,7-dioate isomerase n=1 Tax=Spirosoma montaniterrae TaxID=1178516 RepID=A0A1P9WSU6_9BACT|nr:fumarylacetoacetate hydrolase family protein [Spirosoma montaniterrae]AQG78438.1 2-hydroxyhepta-2,4-diene-1,7-dioate isomerase [Spirosoma montaniterrae]
MKLYRTSAGIVLQKDEQIRLSTHTNWDAYINRDDLLAQAETDFADARPQTAHWLSQQTMLAPIQSQEVWASGVTYLRSRDARMEESRQAGGDTFYDKVYDAERPELFFKATARRTVGTNGHVRIRQDSTWDVPEPELTLFITASGRIVAYTIGNDMSSRSIEGENPLYLPQAKTYEKCAGLGPCLYVSETPLPPDTPISLRINRGGAAAFEGTITLSQMKRQLTELAGYLFRECEFPHGCFLMTGTGIVPDHPFTLQSGDEILITIEPIGTLRNLVE